MPGYTHLQRAVVSSAGMWWAGWAEAFIDNAQRAARHARVGRCQSARHGRGLRREPAARSRAHHASARLRAHAGFAAVRAALARQVRARRAGGAGQRDARPAPPGVGPQPVHDRRIRLRAPARAIHDRQFDHAEQAQPRRRRVDARHVRERRRRAYARSNTCCRCPAVTTAICRSRRARCSMASARAWPRWRCCRICCATWTGTPSACARRSSRRCMRPTSPSILRSRACRSAMPTSRRRIRRSGRKAIPRRACPRGCRRVAQATMKLDELRKRLG